MTKERRAEYIFAQDDIADVDGLLRVREQMPARGPRLGVTWQQRQRGFTLLELLVATVIILVGLVAVAQLVPASVMMNSNNRSDGAGLAFAQRVMEAIRAQPMAASTFSDPQGVVCPLGQACQLGGPTQPLQVV